MLGFPSGIITFLFTDLEESTKLWDDFPKEMKAALARLDVILKSADENKHRKITGDGLDAAFTSQATPLMQHWLPDSLVERTLRSNWTTARAHGPSFW